MSALVSTGDSGRGPSGLFAAFLVALALHVAALVGIAFYRLSPPSPPGENTISIDLAPQMTEADTQTPSEQMESQVAPPETSTEPPNEVAAVKPPEAPPIVPEETLTEKPPEATQPPPVQAVTEPPPDAVPVEPESQVITSTAPEAEPLAPPPPVAAQTPEAKPIEDTKPKPDLAKIAAEREARLKAIREAKRKAQAEERRQELLEERREAAREAKEKAAREAKAKAAVASAGRASQNSASASRQSSAGAASAGNDPNALRQWQGALSSAIHGRMNRNAAAGTAGGVATVRFTVSRSGQVLSAGLAGSSGVGPIDSAALAAVRGTLPAAPPGVTVSSLSVTVPMRFSPGR
ncbi:cell envelope integrity protein TolA [Methylobacterium planeticum]|uniref:Cell envelope integrity protein TolA n=1 Tax=Methylobacterium planeticum TaxID=2615211 RepID=A0A6N6MXV5_9HYPH|nr:cell envelope integrity protein TolA [Methylobacterium planeticum]KAB1076098.1 cell envelope integrity protein TolA [Methylobacterium planeticum]